MFQTKKEIVMVVLLFFVSLGISFWITSLIINSFDLKILPQKQFPLQSYHLIINGKIKEVNKNFLVIGASDNNKGLRVDLSPTYSKAFDIIMGIGKLPELSTDSLINSLHPPINMNSLKKNDFVVATISYDQNNERPFIMNIYRIKTF